MVTSLGLERRPVLSTAQSRNLETQVIVLLVSDSHVNGQAELNQAKSSGGVEHLHY